MKVKNINRDSALIEELQTSVSLLKFGLREVQSIRDGKVFYHLMMLTLANGFERLMKVIICLYKTEKSGDYPNKCPWNTKKGHDLNYLLDMILSECFSEKYLACSGVASTDLDFLKNDQRLKDFVSIISSFGQSARYYNLDLFFTDKKTKTLSPEGEWNKLKKLIIEERPELKSEIFSGNNIDLNMINEVTTKEIVIKLEKFARALARLFTLGDISEQAKRLSPIVYDFLTLRNEQLGERKY